VDVEVEAEAEMEVEVEEVERNNKKGIEERKSLVHH
jgi:hypothetical protein